METVARSKQPDGPYESCPHNPVLTHRSMQSPIQATGHADLVQTPDGDWWALFLGIRPVGYPFRHHLGRETFLAPVAWGDDGWPTIGDNGRVAETMPAGRLPLQPKEELPSRDEFEGAALASQWNFLRTPDRSRWSLGEKESCLTLRGTPETLNDGGAPAFVGRRQQHFDCRASALLSFAPNRDGEEAGLTVYMNEKFHYEIAIAQEMGVRKLIFRRRLGSLWKVEHSIPWDSDEAELIVEADQTTYSFGYVRGEKEPEWLGRGECAMLATEVAGGFTGVMIAMYATGNGAWSNSPAHFDWFEYRHANKY